MEWILSHLQPPKAAPNSLPHYFKGDNPNPSNTTTFTSDFYQKKGLYVSVWYYTPILFIYFKWRTTQTIMLVVFISTREHTLLQGQMLLPTSKSCCIVYYSEDAVEEQGIFLKE